MSIRSNFYYSSILTSLGYIFPLITFPYVSRVLGVTNIGICNFVNSVIDYFVLFSMMGIRTIGIREIAKCQGKKVAMSETFSNLIALNFIFVLFFGLVLFVSIQIVPQFAEHKTLMYIGLSKLLAVFMLIEWLYKGVEDFKYITKRSIVIRCLYVVSVFIFIRNEDDYPVYFTLLVLTEGINAVINCIHARKYVVLNLKNLHPFKYIESSLTLGCYGFLTTMYTTFNVAYLGFITNASEVGYYTTATKLHHIILALFTAFTGVMLPRMSNLIGEGNKKEFTNKIIQSYSVLVHFSFPIIIFVICFAPEIIRILSGTGYEKATTPLMIVTPLVFVVGLEQILVHQILMPLKKDRAIFINSFIGASVGVVANIILVGDLGCIGSAIVWCISEMCVMISALFFVYHDVPLLPLWKNVVVNLFLMIPAIVICLCIRLLFESSVLEFFACSILIILYYSYLYLYIIRDNIIISLLPNKLKKYVK